MKLVYPKNLFYYILYGLCIGVTYLGNYELTFAVWLITAIATLQKRYSYVFLKYLACSVFIVVFAFLMGVFSIDDLFYFIRDITYIGKPVVGLLIGYQICRYNFTRFFKIIIYTGVVIALIHMLVIAKTVVQLHTLNVHRLREFSGFFSDYEVYSLILLVFYKRFGIAMSQRRVLILGTILAISIFLYLARISFIQFIVLAMGMKGFFAINSRSLTRMGLMIMTVLIGYAAIYYSEPKRNGKGLEALFYKIKIAPQESFKTYIDREDYKEFNDNYRSYENIVTTQQMRNSGWKAILFGKGLGATVDLKQKVLLGREPQRYIYVLHNAFMTTYLKTGLLGIAVMLLSIVLLFRQRWSDNYLSNQVGLLLVGTAVFMIMSNWVLMGYYFTNDTKSILVGSLICFRELLEKENRKSGSLTAITD